MSKPRTGKEWAEFLDAKMAERAAAIVPLLESGRVFLTGTPWGARASFQNNHATAHTLPESREHIDAMEYTARWHHRCGMYKTEILGGCEKQRGHDGNCAGPAMHGMDRGMPIYDFPCSCGRTIRGTDRDRGKPCVQCRQQAAMLHEASMEPIPRSMLPSWMADDAIAKPHTACPGCGATVSFTVNDCLAHHAFAGRPCAWNGRQRAVVEQEQRRMREAPGIWCAGNGTWSCSRTDAHTRAACHNGRGESIATGVSDLRPCPRPPQPPTLREWLGDRVSELGRWAEVLREQPVPAGSIVEWRWERFSEHWRLLLRTKGAPGFESLLRTTANPLNHGCGDPFFEAVQMAMFTRNPDVKPEPKPAAFEQRELDARLPLGDDVWRDGVVKPDVVG